MTTRRAFLKAAPAAVAGAMVAPALALPAAAETAASAAPAAVVAANPWRWWVGSEEYLMTAFDNREDAIAHAKAEGYPSVVDARYDDYDLCVDGGDLLEMLYGQNEEKIGEGDWIATTREQERDLARRVNAAIAEWVAANKIDTRAYCLDCRTFIDVEPQP